MKSVSDVFTFRRLRALVAVATIVGTISHGSIRAQDKPAVDKPLISVEMRREPGNIYDPARITGFRLDGQFYSLGTISDRPIFDTTADWIERVEVIALNRSSKTIIASNLQFTCPSIPQDRTNQHRLIFQINVGTPPDRWVYPTNPPPPNFHSGFIQTPISVAPQGNWVFAVKDSLKFNQARLREVPPPTACFVGFRTIHFSDGTMWSPSAQFYKPDPNSDRGYVRITPEEFGMPPIR
jgi:hypothetical protein